MASRERLVRDAALVAGAVLWVAFVLPPLDGWAGRFEYVNSLQFGVFAYWAPALLVVGAPWRVTRAGRAFLGGDRSPTWFSRWWARRESDRRERRAAVVTVTFVALEIVWRITPVVDNVLAHPWGRLIEGLSFLLAGGALFLSLVESPPHTAGTKKVARIFMAAVAMWAIWIIGYMDGMTGAGWYDVFHHVAGRGVSVIADKELSTGVLWVTSAATFIPIVFWNLIHWLQAESTPDEEMYDLMREDRTRGFFGPPR
ncbi:MAG TPA: cytochrome c oxidase assembly protein [Acidimicrobiales bacterium]|nr:cytochrome c oxidase assembly protein [Acidimicrobiales bacterium]